MNSEATHVPIEDLTFFGKLEGACGELYEVVARASGRETRFWLRRAARRRLLAEVQVGRFQEAVDRALKSTNKLIANRRTVTNFAVEENLNGYDLAMDLEHHS